MGDMMDYSKIFLNGNSLFPVHIDVNFLTEKDKLLPKKYIIKQDATILFWRDGTKTISKRHKEDKFNKKIGFLMCCFQHYNADLSRNKRKKILSWVKPECMEEYLFNMFVEKNEMTVKEAEAYLKNLRTEEEIDIKKHKRNKNKRFKGDK